MSEAENKIAKIYFGASIFLTTSGELYGFEAKGGKVKCKKLNAAQKIAFWEVQNRIHKTMLIKWSPVSSNSSGSAVEMKIVHSANIIQRQ